MKIWPFSNEHESQYAGLILRHVSEKISYDISYLFSSGETIISNQSITDHISRNDFTPNDPLLSNQWHLTGTNGINVKKTWDDYTGAGVKIGFIDDGIEYTHPDLNDHYDSSIDFDSGNNTNDGAPKTSSDKHGTTTSGVAAAEGNNGQGVSGVAFEATITSFRINFGSSITDTKLADLFDRQTQVDVSNNSWGFNGFFSDNLTSWVNTKNAIDNAVSNGRGGLGTNIVFAAGNSRESGDNANYHNLQNSKHIITVAATDESGHYTYFSTPGASVLLSAPGWNISSTDRTGSQGYVNGDYVGGLAGTSFSAPIVSGAIALMLDANPNLGYRDVQEILAYSSRNSDQSHSKWEINGAKNWNGGGLHFSNDYGFGLVDATTAVRLAETWLTQSTFSNLDTYNSGVITVNANIPDGNANTGISSIINVNSDIIIDKIEIVLNIAHTWIGDIRAVLTSPNGTESVLINRPGVNPDTNSGYGSSSDNIHFTLSSNAFWGENVTGAWKLTVYDVDSSFTGKFENWSLILNGDSDDHNDVYIYTNEFSNYADSSRTTLNDTDGGIDTINAAGVLANSIINLSPGSTSTIDGVTMNIANGSDIENLYTGDGNDNIIGNLLANVINAGRGNDNVEGAAGNDTLNGNIGYDIVRYLGVFLDYLINIIDIYTVTIQDNNFGDGDEGTDTVINFEEFIFGTLHYTFDGTSFVLIDDSNPQPNQSPVAEDDSISTNEENAVTINVLTNDSDPDGNNSDLDVSAITSDPTHGTVNINPDNTITYTPEEGWFGTDTFIYEISDADGGTDTAQVTVTINDTPPEPNKIINGTSGDDTLTGGTGNDTIYGKKGNDLIYGKSGNDTIDGSYGDDTIYGGAGNDSIKGGWGENKFIGGSGADSLTGNSNGVDTFIYEKMSDAGDTINNFKKGQDVVDLQILMDSIGYSGSNPEGDGIISQAHSGTNLELYIDHDGLDGPDSPVKMLTINNFGSGNLTDYIY